MNIKPSVIRLGYVGLPLFLKLQRKFKTYQKKLINKIYFKFKLNNSGTKIIYQSDSDKYD